MKKTMRKTEVIVCDSPPKGLQTTGPYDRLPISRRGWELKRAGAKNIDIDSVVPIPFAYLVTMSWEEDDADLQEPR